MRSPSEQPSRSPRELAAEKIQLRKQQETLLRDLLTVVDALDRAADHWQQAEASHCQTQGSGSPLKWWQRLLPWWGARAGDQSQTLAEVVTSAREGIMMIRESMLTVLTQHQVVPLLSQDQPFDPSHMHALGQQVDSERPANTVVQEVVRGYRWRDRILREPQVIVAVAPPSDETVDP
ncbi:nucleotide exchange factor GrpE [Synechococcales cyanobacterium C]|uniref:Nucleotide exchange factor GrpE n=2 Tax=Petrachloros TaxID=2918834 RepID=A0A8K2A2K3_9CYAN|nr:nucleotide exchange factor GrpE [Petrachloros mirabilis ULC683]